MKIQIIVPMTAGTWLPDEGADADAEHRGQDDGHQPAAARAQVVAGGEVRSRLSGEQRDADGQRDDGHDDADDQPGEPVGDDAGGEQAAAPGGDEQRGRERAVAVLGARADDAEDQEQRGDAAADRQGAALVGDRLRVAGEDR